MGNKCSSWEIPGKERGAKTKRVTLLKKRSKWGHSPGSQSWLSSAKATTRFSQEN